MLPIILASCSAAVQTNHPATAAIASKVPGPLEGYSFPAVFFDPGKIEMSETQRTYLDEMGLAFRRAGVTRVQLTGHTDDVGDKRTNQSLSLKHAEAVAAELISLGYSDEDITVIGVGSAKPRVTDPDQRDSRFERFVLLQGRD